MEKFEFCTKARNLEQLRNRIRTAEICESSIVTFGSWNASKAMALKEIRKHIIATHVIVRSSAKNEDSVNSSFAGAFESILDVDVSSDEMLMSAIEKVFQSYDEVSEEDEVLVQPMLRNVEISGVVFTREMNTSAPYFVINYDDTSQTTDEITSGKKNHSLTYIHKGSTISEDSGFFANIVALCNELIKICENDSLDIEFAVASNSLYLLQVRPLVSRGIVMKECFDSRVNAVVESVKTMLRWKKSSSGNLFGDTTFFGDMPDWNPAEIIGTFPKPLANSLYQYIIMDSAWREARELMGYNSVRPHNLMVTLASHPYVDVRCSFNSMIPNAISDALKRKLINYYLNKLKQNPHLHDKVEFEILITCLNFDFNRRAEELLDNGFTNQEVLELRIALYNITDALVSDAAGLLKSMEKRVGYLKGSRDIFKTKCIDDVPHNVKMLLDDCIYYGTIPFSVFARNAFIGTSFLKSLVCEGICTQEEYSGFLNSIVTVATEYLVDLNKMNKGQVELSEMIEMYGHLRPGTYDITAESYKQNPDRYFSSTISFNEQPQKFDFSEIIKSRIDSQLKSEGFTFNCEELLDFIRFSISMREKVKFEFTKNLSLAIDMIEEFGLYHGISADEMAFSKIGDIIQLAGENITDKMVNDIKRLVDSNYQQHTWCSRVMLPDLIFDIGDVCCIQYQTRIPNYITQKKIVAPLINLFESESIVDVQELEGKIVLIESADPGFDWIFSKGIAGLVTEYGGAASHMAIRCAELGIPAAIGCGVEMFSSFKSASMLDLNCAEKKVMVYAKR